MVRQPAQTTVFKRREKKERKTDKFDAKRQRLKTTGNGKKPLYVGPDKTKPQRHMSLGLLCMAVGREPVVEFSDNAQTHA